MFRFPILKVRELNDILQEIDFDDPQIVMEPSKTITQELFTYIIHLLQINPLADFKYDLNLNAKALPILTIFYQTSKLLNCTDVPDFSILDLATIKSPPPNSNPLSECGDKFPANQVSANRKEAQSAGFERIYRSGGEIPAATKRGQRSSHIMPDRAKNIYFCPTNCHLHVFGKSSASRFSDFEAGRHEGRNRPNDQGPLGHQK